MSKNKKNDCELVQNYQILYDQTPNSLKELYFGIYPEDSNYNTVRLNYNKLQNYYPCAIFYPNSEKELSYLIKNIVKNNLKFSLRCGARAYEPASLSDGFVIDVSKFNKIKINQEDMTVTVGSGVRLGDLINKLAKYKLIMTTGDSSCVGVSGLSLAGGKGYLTRLFGMVCDNIVSVKMCNWKGELIKSSEKTNSDLFYALKGSGHGSYGAITELKFNIKKDIYCQIVTIKWDWNSNTVLKVINFYQKWIINKPDNITTDVNMIYSSKGASFYIKFFKFSKSKKESDNFSEYIDFINLITKPTITYDSGYYTELLDILVGYNFGKSYTFSKIKSSMIFNAINENGINMVINSINQLIVNKLPFEYQINFTQLGGVVTENKTNSCYYPRNALYVMTILNTWSDPTLNVTGKEYPNNLYNNLIKNNYISKYCLANMIDYDLTDYLTSYYGTNQNKLVQIKNKYDPENIFNWKQSIPIKK